MIKINKKDSIIDIIIKIQNSTDEKIVLDFPFGHPVIHNYTSLKILKNKSGNKELVIIVNDLSAKKIGEKLGIKYSLLNKTNILQENYTFFEYLRFVLKKYKNELNKVFKEKTNKDLNYLIKNNLKYNRSRIGFFIFGLIVSVFLFLFIFYFAVNKTYINITPEITIRNKATNITFKEIKDDSLIYKNDKIVKINEVKKTVQLESSFGTTGFIEKDISKSKGRVVLKNLSDEEIALLPNSRLETGDGITYTINNNVIIPKNNISNSGSIIPGTIEVDVTSKIYDKKGKIIGEKGNIKQGSKLIFPGLKDQSDTIFAESIIDFSGGNNKIEKIVSKDDIKNAKILIRGELESKALKELKKEINLNNKKNNNKFNILGIDKILTYSDFKITGEENINIGDKIERFNLSGEITLTSYVYNHDQVINTLNNTIQSNIVKGTEKLLYINENSIRISNVISKRSNPLTIKATTGVEVYFIHNFLNESNNYIYKLKNQVMGLEKNEAHNLLLNNSKISNVKIDIRPFFINKISKISDNIIINILDE